MKKQIPVGIDSIRFYTSHYYLPLDQLAQKREVDPEKYLIGIGQKGMGVSPPNEDAITLGANAGWCLLQDNDAEPIEICFFATETGVDQAKSGANFIHQLLQLPSRCRVIEVKQACYSATFALQLGLAFLQQHPEKKVLIIASDIARYRLATPEEPTQGCGAVALLLSAFPRLLTVDAEYGLFTQETHDFWRPNSRREALVNSQDSIKCYFHALEKSWEHYVEVSGRKSDDFAYFCYHQPFARMVEKAHKKWTHLNGLAFGMKEKATIQPTLHYTPVIGNSYTASLYIGFASLLEHIPALPEEGQRIAFFSYGSGCMGEYFSGQLVDGFSNHLYKKEHHSLLEKRTALSYEEYEFFHTMPTECDSREKSGYETGNFAFMGTKNEKRIYERCSSSIREQPNAATLSLTHSY